MLNLKKVSVTGDLASGKSEVCRFFSDLGAFTLNADRIATELLVPGTVYGDRVVALLGEDVVVEGQFDRRRVAEKVFKERAGGDFVLLKRLEAILHPGIRRIIEERYLWAVQEGAFPLFVVEVPLLYETKGEGWYDVVIFVLTRSEIRQKRYIKKTGRLDFTERCERFLPTEERVSRSHIIIENNGSLENLGDQVVKYFYSLKEKL
ncbi:MAG: dephospho-CoA kinase [Victivallaceae bacterium]